MTARRRVTGLPRPLPECRVPTCRAPMPRHVWALRPVCEACATPADRMAATQRAAELARASSRTTRTVNDRIEALAARRAARTTTAPQERTA